MIRNNRTIASEFLYVMLLVLALASVRPVTGQFCNASYNSPGGGCSPGSICLYSTNCNSTVSNPCPTGQTCTLINTTTQVGVCVPGTTTCSTTNPCGSGQACAYVNASNVGLCVPSCTTSNTCPGGQTCMDNACIIAGSCSCQLPGCSPSAVPARTFTFTNNCNYPVYVGALGDNPSNNAGTGTTCTTNSDCGVDQFCDSSGSDASNPQCEYVPVNGTVNIVAGTTCNVNSNCTASAPSCSASSDTCLCVGGTCSTYCNSTTNQCTTVPTNGNGFLLTSGQSSSVSVPSDWSGNFWPRTGCPDFSACQPPGNTCSQSSDCCTNDCAMQASGPCTNGTCPTGQTCQNGQCMANICQPAVGACLTGDCDGALNCNQAGSSPATLAEFTLQPFATIAGAGGTCTGSGQSSCPYGQICQGGTCVTPSVDTYDISNIDGPNVPTQISPTANTTLTGVWEPGSVTCKSNSDCYQGQGNALFVCNTVTSQCILPYDCGSPGCSTAASCASFGYSPPNGTTFLGVSSWAYNFQPTGIPCINSTTCPTGQTCQSGSCATACTGGPGLQGTCPAAWQTCTAASHGTCVTNYAPQMQAVAPFQCGVNTTPGPPAACTGGPSSQGTCAAGYLCNAATGGTCAPGCTGGPAQGSCPLGFTCSAASTGICQRPCSVCSSGTCTVTACTSNSDCTAPQVCGIAEVVAAAGASLSPQPPQPGVQVCGQPLPGGSYFGPGEVCSLPGLSTLGPPLSCSSNLGLFGCVPPTPSCYTSKAGTSCCGCASWAPGFGSGGPFPNPAGNACQNTNSTWVANAEVPAAISHVAVPTAYSFPYDDPSGSFICSGQSSTQQVNYTITYCPDGSPGTLVGQGAKAKPRR